MFEHLILNDAPLPHKHTHTHTHTESERERVCVRERERVEWGKQNEMNSQHWYFRGWINLRGLLKILDTLQVSFGYKGFHPDAKIKLDEKQAIEVSVLYVSEIFDLFDIINWKKLCWLYRLKKSNDDSFQDCTLLAHNCSLLCRKSVVTDKKSTNMSKHKL